jgi:hypothetical protein
MEERVADLLHAAIDRSHDRDMAQRPVAEREELAAEEVGGERARGEHDRQGEDDPEPGDVEAEERVAAQLLGQEQQRLVHHVDQELEDPKSDAERDPDEQPGDEVTPEGRHHGVAGLALPSGFAAGSALVSEDLVSEDLVSEDLESEALAPESPLGASSALAAGFFDPEFLKSVAYQPLPFSWKPAAVTILENSGAPHFVQTVNCASLTFCRNSCWWPQRAQRYS